MAATIQGTQFRSKMRFTLLGMGLDVPIFSAGRSFYCTANFTLNKLVVAMTRWAAKHPDGIPTMTHIKAWCREANRSHFVTGHGELISTSPRKKVVIAEVPAKVTTRMRMALTGGLLHEGAHLLYTHQDNLVAKEIAAIVIPLWTRISDWSKYTKPLLTWINLIEDIRIERLLRLNYSNATTQLADLQDLILKMEGKEDGAKWLAQTNELQVVMGAFRDIGLGYNTVLGRCAIDLYKAGNADAWKMVTNGSLTPILKESMKPESGLKTLKLALQVVCEIADLCGDASRPQEPEEGEQPPNETRCPQCNAGARNLTVKALYELDGTRVKGKGVLTCSVCGYQQMVDVNEDSEKGESSNIPQPPQPNFEGFEGDPDAEPQDGEGQPQDQDGEQEGDDSDGNGSSPDSEPSDEEGEEKGTGKGDSDDSDEDINEDPNGGDSDDSEEGEDGDNHTPKEGEGDDSDTSEKEGEEGDSDDSDKEGDDSDGDSDDSDGDDSNEGDEGDSDKETNSHPEFGGQGAGNDSDKDVAQVLADMLNDDQTGIIDRDDSVQEIVEAEDKKEESKLQEGEARYNPLSTEGDVTEVIQSWNKDRDRKTVTRYQKQAAAVSVAIKTRLQRMVRAMETTSVYHGTPKGRSLSSRRYVATWGEMQSGQVPTRPYFQKSDKMDTSIASAIVVDQSGSMSGLLKDTIKGMIALTDALTKIGAAVQVSGYRDGGRWNHEARQEVNHSYHQSNGTRYHRTDYITNDVFMDFGEKFGQVKHRFASLRASGGTPTADGMQFGLDALNNREEGHRIMFVITDGCPYSNHVPVIKHQCRIAAEAGIHIIGVGIGEGTEFVSDLFPDSVYCPDLADLPVKLIGKLKGVLDPSTKKRGRKVKNS